MGDRQTLTRNHWLDTAFRMLGAHGPNAVRVDLMCRELGVTKGSFYWHFKDLPALKAAMVMQWRGTAAHDLIETTTSSDLPPRDLVIRFFEEVLANPARRGGIMAEAAIRQWANADPAIARQVKEADNERLSFLTTQTRAAGLTGAEARSRASFLYAALIGMEHLAAEPALTPANLPGVIDAMLAPPARSDA